MTHSSANLSAIPRAAGGRFAKGGPGRPVGAKARVSRDLLAQVKALGPDAVNKLREAVASGERWAVELVLQHVLPAGRSVEMEGLTADDLREAVANGDLSISEGKDAAAALAKLAEIDSIDALAARIADLEQAVATKAGR